MIKVQTSRGVRPSALLFVGGAAGSLACNNPVGLSPAEPANVDSVNQAVEPLLESAASTDAAQGIISLHDHEYYRTNSRHDEFLRAGDAMKISLPFEEAYLDLHPDDYTLSHRPGNDHLDDIVASMRVSYGNGGGVKEYPITWHVIGGLAFGESEPFTIPTGPDHLELTLVASHGALRGEFNSDFFRHVTVYGAYFPNKVALFDKDGSGTFRTRIVEGGNPTAGANLTVSYVDWRSQTSVDYATLNRAIGEGYSANRFGPMIVPLPGVLDYEITCAMSTDGGATWQGAGPLQENTRAAVLETQSDRQRSAFETVLTLPRTARGLWIAFHTRAVLIARYDSRFTKKYYNEGDRILLADRWDNNLGRNYFVPVDAPR